MDEQLETRSKEIRAEMQTKVDSCSAQSEARSKEIRNEFQGQVELCSSELGVCRTQTEILNNRVEWLKEDVQFQEAKTHEHADKLNLVDAKTEGLSDKVIELQDEIQTLKSQLSTGDNVIIQNNYYITLIAIGRENVDVAAITKPKEVWW